MEKNIFKISGSLTKDPVITEKATFLRITTSNNRDDIDKGIKKYEKVFVNVSFFDKNKKQVDQLNLKTGELIETEGWISNRRSDKGFIIISLIGLKIKKNNRKDGKYAQCT